MGSHGYSRHNTKGKGDVDLKYNRKMHYQYQIRDKIFAVQYKVIYCTKSWLPSPFNSVPPLCCSTKQVSCRTLGRLAAAKGLLRTVLCAPGTFLSLPPFKIQFIGIPDRGCDRSSSIPFGNRRERDPTNPVIVTLRRMSQFVPGFLHHCYEKVVFY